MPETLQPTTADLCRSADVHMGSARAALLVAVKQLDFADQHEAVHLIRTALISVDDARGAIA